MATWGPAGVRATNYQLAKNCDSPLVFATAGAHPLGFSPSAAHSSPTVSCLPDAHRNHSLPDAAEDSHFTSRGAEQKTEREEAGGQGDGDGTHAEP